MFQKIFKLASSHKVATGLVIILVAVGGYYGYKHYKSSNVPTQYVLATVEKGTLITSVSGSGQVSASNQVDVKSKVSGDVIFVGIQEGQEVKSGALLVQLDAQDAQKSVRDAEANLESAQLSLEKLQQPADQLSVLQAENSLSQAQEAKQNAEDDLKKSYDDAINTSANAFLDLPTIMTGLHDILLGYTLSSSQQNMDYYVNAVQTYDSKVVRYRDDAYAAYQKARVAYDQNFIDYKATSRFSDVGAIEALVDESYETTRDIAEAVKNTTNLIQFYEDKVIERSFKPVTTADTHLASLNTYTGKINNQVSNFSSIQQAIKTDKQTIIDSGRTIAERTESLAKLKAGADELDIQSQKLTIKQRENALLDVREKLADYFIRAPFDAVVAQLNVKKGDPVSAGPVIAILVTKQQMAEISLNEVDVAKIKVGQKVTITFDAIDGLSIAGEVAEIATIGTVSQGVVNYAVKIGFDTQDERVKPGMSISANIITNVKQNVLMVPSGAVKSQGNRQYVEMLDQVVPAAAGAQGVTSPVAPREQTVETGLSNDTTTEVTSGLKEGDKVIEQTITGTATTATQSQSSTGLRIPGITGGGGGGFRRPGD